MADQSATVQIDAANSDVPLASVASVSFAATPGAAVPKHGFRVRLDEGSSLVGAGADSKAKISSSTSPKTSTAKSPSPTSPPSNSSTARSVGSPPAPFAEPFNYPFFGTGSQYPARTWTPTTRREPIRFKATSISPTASASTPSPASPGTWTPGTRLPSRYAIEGDGHARRRHRPHQARRQSRPRKTTCPRWRPLRSRPPRAQRRQNPHPRSRRRPRLRPGRPQLDRTRPSQKTLHSAELKIQFTAEPLRSQRTSEAANLIPHLFVLSAPSAALR